MLSTILAIIKFCRHFKPLDVKGVYNFEDQSVVLKFYNQNLEFSLVSISAEYEYNKIKIPENEFKDITEKAFKYNIEPCVEGKTFQFDVNKIKRNIFKTSLLWKYCIFIWRM